MATNAIKYISNVGKSVVYSTVDHIKNSNPAITGFVDTNNDLLKASYDSITHIRRTAQSTANKIMDSRYGDIAKKGFANIKEDIATGKFYNRERIDKIDTEMANKILGGDDDFDFGEDSFSMDDSSSSSSGLSASDLDAVGERTSTAISSIIARTSEESMKANMKAQSLNAKERMFMFNKIHAGLGSINTNISTLMQFATGPMQTHLDNSTKFYLNATDHLTKQTSLLEELVKMQKESMIPTKEKSSKSSRIGMYDILDSNGMPDLETFFKRVKQNIKANDSGMLDMIDFFFESGAMEAMVASPMQFVTDAVAKKLIPKLVTDSMKSFNASLTGIFPGLLMKLQNSESDNPIVNLLKTAFDVSESVSKTMYTGDYEKGRVPFDGITRKSIVEVIPTYLSKIYSVLSGKEEDRYNYQSGRFEKISDIKKAFEERYANMYRGSTKDIEQYMLGVMKETANYSEEAQKQFTKDLQAILQQVYQSGNLFDVNSLDAKTYGLKGGKASEYNVQLIKQIWEQSPYSLRNVLPANILSDRSRHAKDSKSGLSNMDSNFTALFNNAIETATKVKKEKSKKEEAAEKSAIGRYLARKSKKEDAEDEYEYILKDGVVGDAPKGGVLFNIYDEVKLIRELMQSGVSSDIVDNIKARYSKIANKFSGKKENKSDKVTMQSYLEGLSEEEYAAKSKLWKSAQDRKDSMYDKAAGELSPELIKEAAKRHSEKNREMGFIESIIEDSKSDSLKRIYKSFVGAGDAISTPMKPLAFIFNKGEEMIYKLIFGTNKSPEQNENEKVGILGTIQAEAKKTFTDFRGWMEENIFEPLAQNLEEGLGKKILEKLGINVNEFIQKHTGDGTAIGDFKSRFSSQFKKTGMFVKDTVKDAATRASETLELTRKKNESGKAKTDFNTRLANATSVLNNLKSGIGEVENAATGMKRVSKTGVVAVSEGEMIIPADLNPFNVQKNLKDENKAKEKFIKTFGKMNIPNFAKGGEITGSENDTEDDSKLKSLYTMFDKFMAGEIDEEKFGKFFNHIKNKDPERFKTFEEKLKTSDKYKRKKLAKEDFDKGRDKGVFGKATDIIFDSARQAGEYIKGKAEEIAPKDQESEGRKFLSTAWEEIKKNVPEMAAGGAIGAGVSLLTGGIISPIFGAAAGAGLTLLTNSKSVQGALFGEEVTDEKGETKFKKGLLPENFSKNIKKYVPSMAKGGVLGALASLLPGVPGGPVAGLILGSAVGFASKNETIKEALFGNEEKGKKGILPKDFMDRVKKALPKGVAGGIIGAFTGPFGLVTNIAVGSAIGFATETDGVKKFLFGDKENGEKGWIQKMGDHAIGKIKDAWDPLKKELQLLGKGFGDFFKKQFDTFFKEHLGAPMDKIMKSISDHTKKILGGFLKGLMMPITGLLKLPFNIIGGLGNNARAKHIARGQNDYDTAAERLLFRKKHVRQIARFSKGAQRFTRYDEQMAAMDNDQIFGALQNLKELQDANNQINSDIGLEDQIANFRENISQNMNLGWRQTHKLAKGAYKAIGGEKDPNKIAHKLNKYIAGLDLSEEEKKKVSDSAAGLFAAVKEKNTKRAEFGDKQQSAFNNIAEKFGFKIEDANDMSKLLKQFEYEAKARGINTGESPESEATNNLNDAEEKRHKVIVSEIGEIKELLRGLTKDADDESKALREKTLKRNKREITDDFRDVNELNPTFGVKLKRGSRVLKAAIKDDTKEAIDLIKQRRVALDETNTGLRNKIFGNKSIDHKADVGKRDLKTGAMIDEDGNPITSETNKYKSGVERRIEKRIEQLVKLKLIRGKKKNSLAVLDNIQTDDSGIDPELVHSLLNEDDEKPSIFSRFSSIFKKNKEKKAKYAFTSEGKAVRYIEDKSGKLIVDKSDADTAKTIDSVEEAKEKQNGIWDKITNIPTTLGRIFGIGKDGKEDKGDEEGGLFSKILSKAGKWATYAGLVAGIPFLTGVWTEDIWPKLKPVLEPIVDTINNATGGLWDKFKAWFDGNSESGGLPNLLNKAGDWFGERWASGFETILTVVVPKAAEIIVANLPVALVGLAKGLIKGLSLSWDKIWNAGRASTDYDENDLEKSAKSTVSNTSALQSNNKSSSFIANLDLSTWKLGSGSGGSKSGTSTIVTVTQNKNGTQKETTTKNTKTTAEKIIQNTTDNSYITQMSNGSYMTSNKVYTPSSDTYTLSDGSVVDFNILINSDKIIGYTTDQNGNQIPITGKQLLSQPEIASQLGIDSRNLTEADKESNAKNLGVADNRTGWDFLGKLAGKSLLQGSTLGGRIIKNTGRIIAGKKSIINPLRWAGKTIEGVGAGIEGLGKVKPWLKGLAQGGTEAAEVAAKSSGKSGKGFWKNLMQKVSGKDTVEVVVGSTGPGIADNITETMTRAEAISRGFDVSEMTTKNTTKGSKFLNKVDDIANGVKNSKFGTTTKNLWEKVTKKSGKNVAKEVAEEGIENAGKAASKANKGILSEMIQKVIKFITSNIEKLLTNSKIGQYFLTAGKQMGEKLSKEAVEKMIKELTESLTKKITNELGKRLVKITGSALGKIAGGLLSGGAVTLGFGIAGFISGWKNANSIMGITDAVEEPTPVTKLICGLVNGIYEMIPGIGGVIPLLTLFDWMLKIFETLGIFKTFTQGIRDKQQKSADEVKEFNKKYGTNLTVEEYNKAKQRGEKKHDGLISKMFGHKSYIDENGELVTGTGLWDKEKKNNKTEFVDPKQKLAAEAREKREKKKSKKDKNKTKFADPKQVAAAKAREERAKKKAEKKNKKKQKSSEAQVLATGNAIEYTDSFAVNTVMDNANYSSDITWEDSYAVQAEYTDNASALLNSPIQLIYETGTGVSKSINESSSTVAIDKSTLDATAKKIKKFAKNGKVDKIWNQNPTFSDNNILKPYFDISLTIQKLIYTITGSIVELFKPIKEVVNKVKSKSDEIWTTVREIAFGDDSESNGKGSGLFKGKGFISQRDPAIAGKKFGNETIGEAGCAPASAAMAVSGTFDNAVNIAKKYQNKDGVSAGYFKDYFGRQGIQSEYTGGSSDIKANLRSGNNVVLGGQDIGNTSKSRSPFGPNGHYVVANGLSRDGKYISINDPEASRPNIIYPAKKVLSHTKVGVATRGKGFTSKWGFKGKGFNFFRGRAALTADDYRKENLGSYSPLTAEQINEWIAQKNSGSPFNGNGQVFVDAANATGLDPRYIVAHAALESGWGTSRICKEKNNYFGIGAFDSSPYSSAYSFNSGLAAGIIEGVKWIKTNYYDRGQRSLYKMRHNDGTHQYATDPEWDIKIAKIMASCPYPNEKYTQDDAALAAPGTGDPTTGGSESSGGTWVDQLLGVFDKLSVAYGLSSDSSGTSSSTDSGNYNVSGNTVSDPELAKKQKALVEKMYSVKGQLKYSQSARNPENGSADCSSTVQWAYQNIIGIDPGSWTGAQRSDSDTYTVPGATGSKADESKLQLGDLLLKQNPGHVEMYAGNGQMIGHGGGADGSVDGPTVSSLPQSGSKYTLVRRWTGFKGAGSGLDDNSTIVRYAKGASNSTSHISERNIQPGLSNSTKTVIRQSRNIERYNEYDIFGNARSSQNNTQPGMINYTGQLNTIIRLLGSVVSNTALLEQMVTLLTSIVSIMSEEEQAKKDNNQEKLQQLRGRKNKLLTSLNSVSSKTNDDQIAVLVKNAEKLARG